MTTKSPPIPPANQTTKGPGGDVHDNIEQGTTEQPMNPDKQGQSANTKINTTNQGLQQDR